MPIRSSKSRARYIHKRIKDPKRFDPRSFRTISSATGTHRLVLGCPKGKYSPSKDVCKTRMKLQAILHPKEEKRSNPSSCPLCSGKITKIYDKILSIEAQKGSESAFFGEKFRHDFKDDSAVIYGLSDGSLLIKSKKGKKLWKNFSYDL